MIDSSPVRCLPSSCQIDRTSIRVRPEADLSFVSAFLPAKAKEKAVGSATTLSSMMLFRSHSSRQRKVSLMTDQPMELWFGYFCMVLPRTLQIGYLHVWLYLFLISSLTGWGIPYISTSLLSGAARAKPFFHSHLVPWSSTYGKDQDHRGGGNKLFGTDTHLFESNLSRMIASKHLVPCFVTWLLRPLKEKKHTWRAHRE